MSKKMSNAPVYYVLAQAQFNPVIAMEDYVHQIQDKLRLKGYTLFEEKKITQLHFEAPSSSSPPQGKLIELPVWFITQGDQTAGFILGQSSLSYHTTHYSGPTTCFDAFLFALKTIHSIIKLEHLSRLGLRYLNAILPKKGETINQYLVGGLHGINLDSSTRYSLLETVFDINQSPTSTSILVSRIHNRTGQLGYPPDIMPGILIPASQFANKTSASHAVIDLDHFSERQMPMDFTKTNEELTLLHEQVEKVLDTITTDHAKLSWE